MPGGTQFVYNNFMRLFLEGITLSMPLMLYGFEFLIFFFGGTLDSDCENNKASLNFQYFFVGVAGCLLLQLQSGESTRGKLMFFSVAFVLFGILLFTDKCKSQSYQIVLELLLGAFSACDYQLTLLFIRELVGWEESKSIFINNVPYLHFLFGIVIYTSMIPTAPQNDLWTIFGSCLTGVHIMRLLTLLTCFQTQPIVYYFRRFEELKGSILIKSIYKGNSDEIEYLHISNTELTSDLILSTKSLLSGKFRQRFGSILLMNLFLWLQINIFGLNLFSSSISNPSDLHDLPYIVAGLLFLTGILTSIFLKHVKFKLTLFITQTTLLALNITYGLFQYPNIRSQIPILYFLIGGLLFLCMFTVQLIALSMHTTQILPQKGAMIALSMQWISLALLFYIYQYAYQNPDSLHHTWIWIFSFSSIISYFGLCMTKEVYGKTEQQIQDDFGTHTSYKA